MITHTNHTKSWVFMIKVIDGKKYYGSVLPEEALSGFDKELLSIPSYCKGCEYYLLDCEGCKFDKMESK